MQDEMWKVSCSGQKCHVLKFIFIVVSAIYTIQMGLHKSFQPTEQLLIFKIKNQKTKKNPKRQKWGYECCLWIWIYTLVLQNKRQPGSVPCRVQFSPTEIIATPLSWTHSQGNQQTTTYSSKRISCHRTISSLFINYRHLYPKFHLRKLVCWTIWFFCSLILTVTLCLKLFL